MTRFRTTVVVAGVAALLASVASLGSTAGAQTSTTGASSSASVRGVTDDSIHIGLPSIDFSKLKDFGVNIDNGDPKKILDALVAGINARGGVKGRTLQADVVEFNIVNSASVDAACVALTEDQKVFAVIGGFPATFTTGNTCVASHGVPLVATDAGADALALSSATKPVISGSTSTARRYALFAELLAKKGVFKGKTVGIVTDAAESDAVKKNLLPALKKVGVKPKVVLIDDVTGGDTAAEDANWDVYAEKIKAEGVNHLILVGNQVGSITRVLDHGLDVAMSTPTADALAGVAQNVTQYPASAFDGITTITNLTDSERYAQPQTKQCIADFQKAYPDITVKDPSLVPEGQPNWANGIGITCTALSLFTQIAEKAGTQLDKASLYRAATSMSSNFALPISPYNTLGPDKLDANNGFRIAVFDHTIGKSGGLAPKGKLVDLGSGS